MRALFAGGAAAPPLEVTLYIAQSLLFGE